MTQEIIIGNPLSLTREGVAQLFRMKYKNVFFYRGTIGREKYEDKVIQISRQEYLEETNSSDVIAWREYHEAHGYSLSAEDHEASFDQFFICQYEIPNGEYDAFFEELEKKMIVDGLTEDERIKIYSFEDWLYPSDSLRTDKDLLILLTVDFQNNFFDYEDNDPRIIHVPDDVDWYIGHDDMDYESIVEHSRRWS